LFRARISPTAIKCEIYFGIVQKTYFLGFPSLRRSNGENGHAEGDRRDLSRREPVSERAKLKETIKIN
jgi:hypothetical protein